MYNCYLTCPRGLEHIAQLDLANHISSSEIDQGGIRFKTDLEGIYKINIHSRIGMHLLVQLLSFSAEDDSEIYNQVYNFSWDSIINKNQNFMIKIRGYSKQFKNLNYITLKIKDAIVDKIKKIRLSRPSINKVNPDIIISIFISDSKFIIYIDSSGTSLHKRGYRTKIHKASLNEALASGLIMLSNWNRSDPFYDPMCGSGTIPIEAAMIAYNIAPGLLRKHFAFQKWLDYNDNLLADIKNEAQKNINIDSSIKISGSDLLFNNIAIALSSSKSLKLQNHIQFIKKDIKDFTPANSPGVIVTNPPYGERLGKFDEEIILLYKKIGDILKNKCSDFNAYIFTSNIEATKSIGLKVKKRFILKNGTLDCRLLHYPINAGNYSVK